MKEKLKAWSTTYGTIESVSEGDTVTITVTLDKSKLRLKKSIEAAMKKAAFHEVAEDRRKQVAERDKMHQATAKPRKSGLRSQRGLVKEPTPDTIHITSNNDKSVFDVLFVKTKPDESNN